MKNLDRVRDQKIFVWSSFPSSTSWRKKLELSGDSGNLFWEAMAVQGFSRKDCAIQNVLRCRPEEDPDKLALDCCSVYNDEALSRNRGRAVVHVVLGDLAGAQLFGSAFKKDKPIFWHEPWKAYVVLMADPEEVLRRGEGWMQTAWKEKLRAVRAIVDHPGRWGYVKSLDVRPVRTEKEFDFMERDLLRNAKEGDLASMDVEDGKIEGEKRMLVLGFGIGRYSNSKDWTSWNGKNYVVVLDHPENGYSRAHATAMRNRARTIIEDARVKKSLQNGSYDKKACAEMIGARLRGYDYDTQYGTFLRHSFLRSCGLENLSYQFFPEYGDYKDTVAEWETADFSGYGKVPLDRLLLRNGGDCSLTKQLEVKFSNQVPRELVKVYIHAGITLDQMEARGPLLDRKALARARKAIPEMIKEVDNALFRISGKMDFNANSPDVAALLFDKLGMQQIEGRSTAAPILDQLLVETGNVAIELVQKRRSLEKIEGTYLDGYERSAEMHEGELRTIWWLTGAVTGRLRSGKGDKSELKGIINFQNLHGNVLLQNLLVSDPEWRKAL